MLKVKERNENEKNDTVLNFLELLFFFWCSKLKGEKNNEENFTIQIFLFFLVIKVREKKKQENYTVQNFLSLFFSGSQSSRETKNEEHDTVLNFISLFFLMLKLKQTKIEEDDKPPINVSLKWSS